ncbi:hypothetical protein OROMI_021810 [Orobanche minor]
MTSPMVETAKDVLDDDGERPSNLRRLGDDRMGEGNEGVKDVMKEMKEFVKLLEAEINKFNGVFLDQEEE